MKLPSNPYISHDEQKAWEIFKILYDRSISRRQDLAAIVYDGAISRKQDLAEDFTEVLIHESFAVAAQFNRISQEKLSEGLYSHD